MLFSLCKEKHQATQVITYELWEHQSATGQPHSWSIKKRNTLDNHIQRVIAESIKSKQAIDLIWSDILAGEQK